MTEVWRPICALQGFYEVSSLGNVRSVTHRLIKQERMKNGYMRFSGTIDSRRFKLLVHRAVAMAFVANPEDKPCVNHLDRVRDNNVYTNLEWCTYQENTKHIELTGGHKPAIGNRSGNGKKTHCIHGHRFTPLNTSSVITPNGSPHGRRCKTCHSSRAREYY